MNTARPRHVQTERKQSWCLSGITSWNQRTHVVLMVTLLITGANETGNKLALTCWDKFRTRSTPRHSHCTPTGCSGTLPITMLSMLTHPRDGKSAYNPRVIVIVPNLAPTSHPRKWEQTDHLKHSQVCAQRCLFAWSLLVALASALASFLLPSGGPCLQCLCRSCSGCLALQHGVHLWRSVLTVLPAGGS